MQNNKSVDEEKADPKENARMVENNEREKDPDMEPSPSRWDDLSRRAKHFASNKYNLIIVLLCILLLIFFFVIIGLGARLGSITCPQPDYCRTSECLSAAAAVVGRADYNAEPCTDFWQYSCNGWFARNSLPENKGSVSVVDDLRGTIYSRVRHLIDLVPHDTEFSSPQIKVKHFYTACMNLPEIEYWLPSKFSYIIQEIGGWELLKKPRSTQWNRNNVLQKLQVMYGVPVFFRILVEPNDVDPVANIIKLVPDGLGLPGPKYYTNPHDHVLVRAYKDFIKNLMLVMGVELHEASRFAEDIFHYEKRLAEIMPDKTVLRNPLKSYTVMKLTELDKLSTSILWSDLLRMYFKETFSPDTDVALLSEQYFSDLSKLISATDTRLLNDYFMWRLLFTYVKHLSSRHRMVANQFKQAFEGVDDVDSPNMDRWEFCIELTNQYLGHAVGTMYGEKYGTPVDHKEVGSYIHRIIGAFATVIRRLYWVADASTRDAALEKMLSMILQVENPGFDHSCSLVDYYKELDVEADYFQNIKNGVYFMQRKQADMLKDNASSVCSWPVPSHDVTALYSYAGNQLVVPSGLLQQPLFDFHAPLAMKYGVLAGHVADKLAKVFDPKGINYETYGILKPWMSNLSRGVYQEKLNCLYKNLATYIEQNVSVEPNLTLNSLVSDVGGVKLAFEAYRSHSKETGGDKALPGLDENGDRLFFISYAQSLCETTRRQKLLAFRDAWETPPAKLRVLGVLQQLPEFSSTFSCGSSSKMNSANKCSMW